jgi:hypothetical protein
MQRKTFAGAMAVLFWLPAVGQAAKVKVWHHHAASHYEKAHFKHAVVSSEGALRLSRQLKPLAALQAMHVWSVVEDRAGNLFVATGDEGKIFKLTPAGDVSIAYTSDDSQVFCLATSPDGDVYAGTGPSGIILRINPEGKGEVLYKSPEAYIWSLAIDPTTKTIYAGTGPKGNIYAVNREGKARLFYATRREHVLTLAMGPEGLLYAGTDKDGLVYRIDSNGKGFVLYSTPQSEVRSLLVTADAVYAGTGSPTRRRGAPLSLPSSGRTAGANSLNLTTVAVSETRMKARTATEESSSGNPHSSAPSSADSAERSSAISANPPKTGENSLYRILPDGTVREIFREKVLLLSLLRQNSRLLVGTGMEGQLFDLDEASKERSEIARLDHGQVHCLCRRRDGSIVLGTGDPGKLYVLQDKFSQSGTVTSEVLDAKLISRWGSLRWQADTPAGTRVSVAIRCGNTAEPNETWSDWSPEETDARQAAIRAPSSRFLQYRVTLLTESPEVTPVVHSLALRYMTANQAPEVTSIQVPDLDAVNLENPKKLRIKWTATDPNDDDLTYGLFVRKDGWKNWVRLEESLDRAEYEWDTSTMPSGTYQVKIVASDRKDNPAEESLTGERISGPFAVTHLPPTVEMSVAGMDGGQAIIEATATDPVVRLTSASFSVNGKKWVNVFPTDGLFDSKSESFRFKTDSLQPGTYVVVLRVQDAAGNTGSADAVFTVKSKSSDR